jgi:hypothetical protein
MQHFKISAGVERDAVVGKHQLASLQVGQAAQNNDWHFFEAQLARGGEPPSAGVSTPECHRREHVPLAACSERASSRLVGILVVALASCHPLKSAPISSVMTRTPFQTILLVLFSATSLPGTGGRKLLALIWLRMKRTPAPRLLISASVAAACIVESIAAMISP